MSFASAWAKTIGHEKGYSNRPKDAGGETMHGITAKVARANGFFGEMRDLSLETAQAIGKRQYWDLLRLDEINGQSPAIAEELFDSSYNCGTTQAGKWLQRSLNALNREQTDWQDVEDDGLIGPMTLTAFRAFLTKRGVSGEVVLLRLLNCLQGAFYVDISQSRQANEEFVFGWLLNRVQIAST